jgi:hypothetical protein
MFHDSEIRKTQFLNPP